MSSVGTAMLSSVPSRRRCCPRVIGVGVASTAAGSRCPALRHRGVAAILVTGSPQPDNLQAKRKIRIIFLGPGWSGCQNRPDYQKRKSKTTHRNLHDVGGTASAHRSRQAKLIPVNSRSLASACGRGASKSSIAPNAIPQMSSRVNVLKSRSDALCIRPCMPGWRAAAGSCGRGTAPR